LLNLISLICFGLMPFYTLPILSTGCPHPCCPMNPHSPTSFSAHPTTHYFVSSVVLHIPYFVHTIPINLHLKSSNVCLLVSAPTIRAIDALIPLLIVFTFPGMWFLMNCCFQPNFDLFFLLPGFQHLRHHPLSSSCPTTSSHILPLIIQLHPLLFHWLFQHNLCPLLLGVLPPLQFLLLPLLVLILETLTHYIASVSSLQVVPATTSPQAAPSLPASHQMVTRSKTSSLRPKSYADFQLFYSTHQPLRALHSTLVSEPTCFSEASKSPEWRDAMNQEFDALLSQNTWSLCPLPIGCHAIQNKWVYKLKQKPDGSIKRYKARLVAKGFDQRCGLDYTETFSPVIKPATVRVVLAIVVHFNWSVQQLDISNTFLHGQLQEDVYMTQPQGFVHPEFPNHVCKLHKAIYGLKQAPRAWFNRLSDSLLEFGFTQSLVHTSLFLFHQGAVHLFLLIYVDDILITGTHSSVIVTLLAKLQTDFALKDLGELSYFLGIQVQRTATSLHLR